MIKGPMKKKEEKTNVKAKEEKSRSKSKSKDEAPKKNQKSAKPEKKEIENAPKVKEEVKKNPRSNPFLLFQTEARPQVIKDNPGAKPKEVMTILANRWKALDDSERKKYVDLAAKAKAQHQKDSEGGNDHKNAKRKRSIGKNESKEYLTN